MLCMDRSIINLRSVIIGGVYKLFRKEPILTILVSLPSLENQVKYLKKGRLKNFGGANVISLIGILLLRHYKERNNYLLPIGFYCKY